MKADDTISAWGLAACKMQVINSYSGIAGHIYSVAPGARVEDRWLLACISHRRAFLYRCFSSGFPTESSSL